MTQVVPQTEMSKMNANSVYKTYEHRQEPLESTQETSTRVDRLLICGKYEPMVDMNNGEHEEENQNIKDKSSSEKDVFHIKYDMTTSIDDFELAKEFFHQNFFLLFVCMLSGLYTLMFIPSIARLLFYTNNSDSPSKTFKRYVNTLNHTIQWYLTPNRRRTSLATVRKLHTTAVKQVISRIKKENIVVTENGAVLMSQYDLVLTQWAFIGPVLTQPQNIGFNDITKTQMKYLVNQMYIVGRDLGIDDKFNLCTGSIEDVIVYAKDIENRLIRPALEHNEDFKSMSQHLIEGMNILNLFIDPIAFPAWVHKLFGTHKSYLTRFEMIESSKTRAMYHLQCFLFEHVLKNRLMRWCVIGILNTLMDLNVYMANRFGQKITQKYYPSGMGLPLHLWIYGIASYIKLRLTIIIHKYSKLA